MRSPFTLSEKSVIFFKLFEGKEYIELDNIPNRHDIVVMTKRLKRDGIITVERANPMSPNGKITKIYLTEKGREKILEHFERQSREQTNGRHRINKNKIEGSGRTHTAD